MAAQVRGSVRKQSRTKKSERKNSKKQIRAKGSVRKGATKKRSAKVVVKPTVAAAPVRKRFKKVSVEQLILTHRENGRKLARSILRRWQVNLPLEEIDSLVDLTLCEAAGRYDHRKGASFITFFFYHLRGHLVRAVASAASESNMFLALAQSAGVDVSDWTTAEEKGAELAPDFVDDSHRDVESPEQMLLKKERVELCHGAVTKLDELERQVIDRSYSQDEALVDIAKLLGYSRCHISRVKKRALDRLKEFIGSRSADYAAEFVRGEDEEEFLAERDVMHERGGRPRRVRRRRMAIPQEVAVQAA